MDSTTTRLLWLESFEESVTRWAEIEDEADRQPPAPKDAVSRARTRVNKLKHACPMEFPKPITSERQWEMHEPREPIARLQKALRDIGWKVIIAEGPGSRNKALVQHEAIEGDLVMFDVMTTEKTLEGLRAAGCPYPLVLEDALSLRLAEELFHALVERLGNAPRDAWVDELALPLFCQEALGWPFNSLPARLIETRG